MITITNLTKKFGKKTVFKNFSVTLPSNGLIALSGESGAGKTTLLRMIAGLDTKYSGKIDLGQHTGISYAFQESRLLNTSTVLENVSLPLGNTKEAKEIAAFCLSELGLGNELRSYPEELSGGMKQRVSIARALAFDGDVILLDEPFNGIDENRVDDIIKLIKRLSKTRLFIIVSHNAEHIEKLGCKILKI